MALMNNLKNSYENTVKWFEPRHTNLQEKIIEAVLDRHVLDNYPCDHQEGVIKVFLRNNGFVDFAPITRDLIYETDSIRFRQRIWIEDGQNDIIEKYGRDWHEGRSIDDIIESNEAPRADFKLPDELFEIDI